MGVKTLWSVIGAVGEPTDLRSLQGKCIAIDLAGWAVQGGQCAGMQRSGVTKPHLRNLFFRTAALLYLNIRPIFVLDGDAPELKRAELIIRRRAEINTKCQSQGTNIDEGEIKLNRSRLKGVMKECAELLDCLGVAWVQAVGEAESAAAKLNAEGKVDAVITDDSDAFCYGAITVLRNFTISGSNATGGIASVESYNIEKLASTLNIDRRRLIFMALLLGCDFFPTGVPGLGKEIVRQLLALWPLSWDPIQIMQMWIHQNFQELPILGIGQQAAEGKKKCKKQSKSYLCHECSEAIQNNIESGIKNITKKHCIDCEDWRRYVFCVSDYNYNNDCHCDVLKNDSIENTFEGESKSMVKLENMVKKRCRAMHDIEESKADTQFWGKDFLKIIDEFENAKNGRLVPQKGGSKKQPKHIDVLKLNDHYWKNQQAFPPPTAVPDIMRFVFLATKKLSWTDEYAMEKILPIACRTQLSVIIEEQLSEDKDNACGVKNTFILEPVFLTKRRIASGIPSFNVEWKKKLFYCGAENECPENMIPESYESCEPECLLIKSYPKLIELFEEEEEEGTKKKTKVRKPKAIKNIPKENKAQKPITEFFVQAKDSRRGCKETLCKNKETTSEMCSKKVHTISSQAVINKKKTKNILQEIKIDNNIRIANIMNEKVMVTPAVERTKRELLRKIFEESPDPTTCVSLNEKYDSSKPKENKPLQSTPKQPIPKRVKDHTHKTPKMLSSELNDDQNLDTSTMANDSAFACEDLSFIIEDILSKRIESHTLPNLKGENNLQVKESSSTNTKVDLAVTESANSSNKIKSSSGPKKFQGNKTNPFLDLDDTLEDSFDRMCL